MRFNPVDTKQLFVTNVSCEILQKNKDELPLITTLLWGQPICTHYPLRQLSYHASCASASQSCAYVIVAAAAQHTLKLNYRPFSQSFPQDQGQTAGDIWPQASIFAAIRLSCWGMTFSLSWQHWGGEPSHPFPVTNLQNRMMWARWPPDHEVDIHITDWKRKEKKKQVMLDGKRSAHLLLMHPWHCKKAG